jgi:indole-3-glycerol phosphate synthase
MLKKIIAEKEKEIQNLVETELSRRPKDFRACLSKPGLSFIAEIKRSSPSKGELSPILNPIHLLEQYLAGGADAVSVLTDETFFGGRLSDCEKISTYLDKSPVCVLRKDFIIDERQISESINAGADVILLIAAILGDKIEFFLKKANEYGISAIVEVHSDNELDLALKFGSDIIGVNNRNLDTFETDLKTSLRLIQRIPDTVLTIAESAIHQEEDIRRLKEAGFNGVLIGEALVTSKNPAAKLKKWKSVV